MTRATPLPPDQRRLALIDATQPLLLQHGANLTTRQIAEAAGVAEGTIFRVFQSKQDLISQAVARALSHDALADALLVLPAEDSLAGHVEAVIASLQTHLRQTHALIPLLAHDGPCRPSPEARRERSRAMHAAVRASLAPYADELGVPDASAASLLVALAFATVMPLAFDETLDSPRAIAEIVLHGITRRGEQC